MNNVAAAVWDVAGLHDSQWFTDNILVLLCCTTAGKISWKCGVGKTPAMSWFDQQYVQFSDRVCIPKISQRKQTNTSVIFQIIAFDELRTDFKNPIDQSNPTRAVRNLLFHFFQGWSNPQKSPHYQEEPSTITTKRWKYTYVPVHSHKNTFSWSRLHQQHTEFIQNVLPL